eukprot:TRINITY_DN17016_c0_g1_i2.p1 TRINITY_DN17016_c0_g1~~TRINITY_DN17016_c0_g1_i2.p1  ORF type:complete len:1094 (+),score=263.27 TRINITY_DN17016_c0_g1_i2:74-3355(+)
MLTTSRKGTASKVVPVVLVCLGALLVFASHQSSTPRPSPRAVQPDIAEPAPPTVRRVLTVHAPSSPEPLTERWEQVSETLFQRGVHRRTLGLQQLINQGFDPWDIPNGRYIWDWFSPDFVCPTMERMGRLGDGGKWICHPDRLPEKSDCVVYSFGVRDDVTFEQEIIERSGQRCEVHAFDPSVGGLPQYAKHTPKLHFHKAALAAHTGSNKLWPVANSLHGHMERLGHTHVDVLKIDCEGCEWEVFEALLESDSALPFSQLLIELHLGNATSTEGMRENMFRLFEGLEALGFRAFAREINIGPTLTGQLPTACEFSFIKNSVLQLPAPRPRAALVLTPPRLKAAIYVLVNPARLTQLMMMLQQLHTNFNNEYKYPIVLFHDTPLSPEQRSAITRDGQWSWIKFEAIELSLSALEPELPAEEVPERTPCAPTRLFYRHMCRFHAIEASRRMSELGFEWHWRMDDDSRLGAPVGYDVFELMATNKMLYSYLDVVQEEHKCVANLWELADVHLAKRKLIPTFYHEWPEGVVFYNNFEISHHSVWESPEVQHWMQAVRTSRGIYTSRWGDAPIRTLAVAMFVDPLRVHRFSDLAYSHLPLFKQAAASLPFLGLGAVQSALCTHIRYWDLAPNASAMAGCIPLLEHKDLKFHLPSPATSAHPKRLGDDMGTSCTAQLLRPEVQDRCALDVTAPKESFKSELAGVSMSASPATDLQPLLSIQQQGMLGTDIATSVRLPSPNGTTRVLWLLGDTPWGSYDSKSCVRKTKAMPRNMLAISTKEQTCFHYKQGDELLPVDLLQPAGNNDASLLQQHWWWVFNGLMHNGKLYLFGADFWLAPHTMWMSQGTLLWIVSNPEAPVHQWEYTQSYLNKHPSLHWYSGVAKRGEYVYLVGSYEDESHMRKHETPHGEEIEKGLVMSRIKATQFEALEWDRIQYWDGESWSEHTEQQTVPSLSPVLFHTGGGETTLQWDENLRVWYMLFVQQQDHNNILMHYSSSVEGPWQAVRVYQPPAPFTDTKHYMCYAVKSHPDLAGKDEIVFSHVCTKRPWTWPGMTNVYVPQFTRIKLSTTKQQRDPLVRVLSPAEAQDALAQDVLSMTKVK